ncbi:unnamed protein product [Closterium sp. NIES-54]
MSRLKNQPLSSLTSHRNPPADATAAADFAQESTVRLFDAPASVAMRLRHWAHHTMAPQALSLALHVLHPLASSSCLSSSFPALPSPALAALPAPAAAAAAAALLSAAAGAAGETAAGNADAAAPPAAPAATPFPWLSKGQATGAAGPCGLALASHPPASLVPPAALDAGSAAAAAAAAAAGGAVAAGLAAAAADSPGKHHLLFFPGLTNDTAPALAPPSSTAAASAAASAAAAAADSGMRVGRGVTGEEVKARKGGLEVAKAAVAVREVALGLLVLSKDILNPTLTVPCRPIPSVRKLPPPPVLPGRHPTSDAVTINYTTPPSAGISSLAPTGLGTGTNHSLTAATNAAITTSSGAVAAAPGGSGSGEAPGAGSGSGAAVAARIDNAACSVRATAAATAAAAAAAAAAARASQGLPPSRLPDSGPPLLHRKLKQVPLQARPGPEIIWVTDLTGGPGGERDVKSPYSWLEFTRSPARARAIRVGQWADIFLNHYEHVCKHATNVVEQICPPMFFISKDPFSPAALRTYDLLSASSSSSSSSSTPPVPFTRTPHPGASLSPPASANIAARTASAATPAAAAATSSHSTAPSLSPSPSPSPAPAPLSPPSPAEPFLYSFLVVERRHMLEVPPEVAARLPWHMWPVVVPDHSHPAELCEAAKLVAESMLGMGPKSYALIPSHTRFYEFISSPSLSTPSPSQQQHHQHQTHQQQQQQESVAPRALQFAQAVLAAERAASHRSLQHHMGEREFKTSLVALAMEDAHGTVEGRMAFHRFNVGYDAALGSIAQGGRGGGGGGGGSGGAVSAGALQMKIEELFDPLLPTVKERLEELLEDVHAVAAVSLSHGAYARQRHLLLRLHAANYEAGGPPSSLITLNDIESQRPFSYCGPSRVLDEVLVPHACSEEEFLQQWRTVQKIFFLQLLECGRRVLWTPQFHAVDVPPGSVRPSKGTRPGGL